MPCTQRAKPSALLLPGASQQPASHAHLATASSSQVQLAVTDLSSRKKEASSSSSVSQLP